jgi:hypothetical protein
MLNKLFDPKEIGEVNESKAADLKIRPTEINMKELKK